MSLVGTRPPTLDEWEKYELHHRARLTYIASWCESKDMKALRASMDTIRKTSAEVIENIETQMHELEMERPVRDTFHKEDLILHLSGSMGSEFTYDLIENMSREQLEQNVGEYVRLTMALMKKPDGTSRTSCSNRQSRHSKNNRKCRHNPRSDSNNLEKHKRRNQSWQTGRRSWIMENIFAVQRWQKKPITT